MCYQLITCPFCSLFCDDLLLQIPNDLSTLQIPNCPKAHGHFMQLTQNYQSLPKYRGASISLENAIQHAAYSLQKARQPLYAHLDTDVQGMQAVFSLMEITKGILDHDHGSNFLLALQKGGCIGTTLTEIRQHADLVLWIGKVDLTANWPRFLEKIGDRAQHVVLGEVIGLSATDSIPISEIDILDCILILRALLKKRVVQVSQVAGLSLNDLENLLNRLRGSQYGVIIWEQIADVYLIQNLCELVQELSQFTYFSVFPLLNNPTAIQVCTWELGFPFRFNWLERRYDPWQYDGQRLLKTQEVDLLVWIAHFHPPKLPDTKILQLVFSPFEPLPTQSPNVLWVPVGMPGIDQAGQVCRLDQVVMLALHQIRSLGLLSLSDVIEAIVYRMSQR